VQTMLTVLTQTAAHSFRKKVYRSIDELQADLDAWLREYNESRPHQGQWCFGKTPMQTFLDALPMTKEKMIAARSTSDSNTRSFNRHRLSDRVSANTIYSPKGSLFCHLPLTAQEP
jgi:Integrase core domain